MGSSNCKSFSPSKVAGSIKSKPMKNCDEYVEGIVCQESDINENEIKSFNLGDEGGQVMIVKQKGVISALGTKCTHYGAPLTGSALGDGRVRCQWHGACFNIKTGDIEDFPGLDSLPCYQVTVQDGNVKVRAKKIELETNKRVKKMVSRVHSEKSTYVVIGGGPSSAVCVETLRQEGFQGRIVLICKESYLPYDRVKVSKILDMDINKTQFRNTEFYKENGIEVLMNTEATGLNTENHTVSLSNGVTLNYDKVYIATGSKPLVADIPGKDLKNVCVLRDYEDARYLNAQLTKDKEIVILGSSFIALESAAYCVNKVAKVTIVARGDAPLEHVFGSEIGNRIKTLFESNNVNFVFRSGITKCIGENGNITSVELIDGQVLKADICIMGIGSTLYTDFLKDSGLDMNQNGSIPVNSYMETNISNVYAGGDIAFAPIYSHGNERAMIGHYPLAHYHGRIAGLNMAGKKTESKSVPFFWSMLFGKSIRYVGYGRYDSMKIEGSINDLKFVVFYFKEDRVTAIASCHWDPIVSQYAELLSQGKQLLKSEIECDSFAWTTPIDCA